MSEIAAIRERLLTEIRSYGSCAVAFSGGVDSTVVAKAAHLALGDQAVAITANSPSVATGEVEQAQELAALIGIRHLIVETEEMLNPRYQANDFRRCYHCKSELYARMAAQTDQWGVKVLANGANLDDVGDYRPGMQAAKENRVRSPLIEVGIGKAEVRRLAEAWQLPVWNKPAMPCLSSRIAYGVEVTEDRLRMVDDGERWLKDRGFPEVRLRFHEGELARIEVPPQEIARLLDTTLQSELVHYLQSLGFRFVTIDLAGLRSGSLNAMVPVELIEVRPQNP